MRTTKASIPSLRIVLMSLVMAMLLVLDGCGPPPKNAANVCYIEAVMLACNNEHHQELARDLRRDRERAEFVRQVEDMLRRKREQRPILSGPGGDNGPML